MNWNDSIYTEIVKKYHVLDSKRESVAVAVLALTKNKDMTPQDWRDLSKKTGVAVAGRAIGSAREILGMKGGPARKKKSKRGPGRPKGSKNKRRAVSSVDLGGTVDTLIATIRDLQRERDQAVRALEKVRNLVNGL